MRKLTTTMKVLMLLAVFIWPAMNGSGQIVISQYIETNSGTAPKGIELWNTSASTIDFSVTNLDILKGNNGGAPASDILINTGTLAAGEVIVVGTSNLSPDYEKGFLFNGDDALVIQLGGVTVDVFGTPGSDPGSSWDGNGVSTANQNIQLKTGITTGDTDGWTDPSERFEMVSADPVNDITGFGVAPTTGGSPDPEPSNHVTAFSASNDDPNTITLTWTDNDGAQAASAFLLKANTGAITAPIDATAEVDDTDLSDGAAVVSVAHGVGTYVFAGLPAGQTYNFEIYPYTNSGADIDYKTDGTVPATTGSTTAAIVPTKLVITSVTPASPYTGQLFEVVVEAQDATNVTGNVNVDTDVQLNVAVGTGTISGTVTGTILNGTSSITFSDLAYDVIETMEVNVSATAGMVLTTSANESIVVTDAPAIPNVFISEYIEGGGNSKALEIFNGTGAILDLTGYSLKKSSNGDGVWGSEEILTGNVDIDDVFVVANSSADAAILAVSDITSTITYYNGNDAVGLFFNGILIDVIGIPDVDPGSGWAVAGAADATANHTLVRKYPDVTTGNIDWVASAGTDVATSEWVVYDQNTFSYLGWHGVEPVVPVIANIAMTPEFPSSADVVTVTADVTVSAGSIASVVLNYGTETGIYPTPVTMTIASGDTYTGEIPAQADGTMVYYQITATDAAAAVTNSVEQSYLVSDGPIAVADIAALRAGLTNGTTYEFTGEAVLTFQQSNRNQKYVEDATGAILIDDNANVITTVYNQYDGITGITGTLNLYNGLLQLIPVSDPGVATSNGNIVTPQIVAITDVTSNVDAYESELITFENVTFTDAGGTFATSSNYELSDGTNTINLRTNFWGADYIGATIPAGPQNITALVADFNGTAQIYARDAADMLSLHPAISNITALPVEPSSTEDVTVTADVIDGNGTIASVVLNWGVATAELTNTVAMTATGDTYTGMIPAQADGTTVYYQIVATDNDANETASAEMTYNVVDYAIATQLSIASVTPASPYIGQAFSIEIHALDATSAIGTVSEDTEVQINLATGTGIITGTVTGTILNGTSSVTISGLTYDVAETMSVNATAITGMTLTASADVDIIVNDAPTVPNVFISEYIEGGGNSKALEIFNGTGANIAMENFRIAYANNGGGWLQDTTFASGITVAAGDVYVVAADQADAAILAVADETYSYPSVCHFNGDDAIALEYTEDGGTTWTIIDIIGDPNNDPGAGWAVAGTVDATKDHTLVRKFPDVAMGNTDWVLSAGTNADDSEWVVYEQNNFSFLGWHGTPPEEPVIANITVTPIMPTSGDAVSISADVTSPNGTISTVTLNWGTVSGTLDQTITMSVGTAPNYVTDTDIPAQADGTVVYYAITAIDDAALETVTNEKSYTVNDPSVVALPYGHDFTDNTFGELTAYSVVGDQVWEVTSYGNPAPGAKITGFSGSNYANEDWMITPGLDFSTVTEAKLVFDEAINYATNVSEEMPIMVSTNYAGTGDPSLATWTELSVTGRSAGNSWSFVTVNDVDLSAYAGEVTVYVAFKYTSTTTSGATWEVDNILVEEGGALMAPVIENIATNPAEPTTSDAVSISATITDANGTVESAVLHWGTDVFYGNTINMAIESGDTWVTETDIPAQANNTRIFYKILAADNESNETTSEDMTYYSFDPYAGVLPYYEPFYYGLGTMSQISVTGTQTWRWDDYGYAKVSGFAGSAKDNEDWLITPSLDFSGVANVALNFREAINFAVNITDEQKVMISTDYDGTSAPSTATWTELTITNRPAGDSWTFVGVDEVDLTDYVGETSVYIAFKYISTPAGAATWEVDEVSVSEGNGILFNSAKQLNVYPNPAHSELFVAGVENAQVEVITLDGKVVMSQQTTNSSINVSNLNNGLYIVRVISGSEVFTTRFVKE